MSKPLFGPASESPSRMQRFIIGGPFLIQAMFIAFVGASLAAAMTVARRGLVQLVWLLWVGIFVVGTATYYFLSPDRKKSSAERLEARVLYWSFNPIRSVADLSRTAVFVLATLGVIGIWYASSLLEPGSGLEVASRLAAIAMLVAVYAKVSRR